MKNLGQVIEERRIEKEKRLPLPAAQIGRPSRQQNAMADVFVELDDARQILERIVSVRLDRARVRREARQDKCERERRPRMRWRPRDAYLGRARFDTLDCAAALQHKRAGEKRNREQQQCNLRDAAVVMHFDRMPARRDRHSDEAGRQHHRRRANAIDAGAPIRVIRHLEECDAIAAGDVELRARIRRAHDRATRNDGRRCG